MIVQPRDLHESAYFDDPFPVWERLRHDQPLFHDTVDDRWLLTRYDDVAEVFRDHQTYSTAPYERIFTDVIGPTMVQMDGDDHDVRRAIVAPVLVGRRLETNYLPLINTVVQDLLDKLPTTGPIDLIAAFTAPLPLKVIATVLGLREDDDVYLAEVTAKVIAALSGEEPGRTVGIHAHAAFTSHIDGLIEERTARPGTDLISGIAHGRTEAGERLSRQEIASFIALMMVAGGETTDRGLANFVTILLEHPETLSALRSDASLVDAAFSEFMRRDGVVVYEDRELRRDVVWHGQTITAGEIVRVALISANNDETVFAEPRRFDLARPDLPLGKESRAGSRIDAVANHLGFGLGKHFCIGYQLARAEIVAATRGLLERMPNLRMAGDDDPPRLRIDWFHRHVERLVVEAGAEPVQQG
ncbi:MAG: cytochrome P450 [Chloroflexota bacterium]|nr:cytochrome P450 [Chloroflexota bacterium]